jgi:hypothetical protein
MRTGRRREAIYKLWIACRNPNSRATLLLPLEDAVNVIVSYSVTERIVLFSREILTRGVWNIGTGRERYTKGDKRELSGFTRRLTLI